MLIEQKCPLCECNANAEKHAWSSREFELDVSCRFCGSFLITSTAISELKPNESKRIQLSHLLAEMILKGRSPITVIGNSQKEGNFKDSPKTVDDILRDYPKSIPERMDRALSNIARLSSGKLGEEIRISNLLSAKGYLQIFAMDFGETIGVVEYLKDLEFLSFCKEDTSVKVTMQPKGWMHFSNLEKSSQNSNTAFVAMWFNDSTDIFAECVHQAIQKAGYECKIVNRVHHNNYIMDEVINLIKESRFVIADFTCIPECIADEKVSGGVRGGIYYEAGFAKGLGKHVIVTCRDDDDSKKRRHFDINQLNTIFWKYENKTLKVGEFEFVEFLCERIKATIGHRE